MASRSIWKGTLNFGMVVMPVKLFNGTTDGDKELAMVNLHATCKSHLKQPKFCPECNKQVELTEVVKGVEIGKNQYLEITDDELASLPLSSTSTITIEQFVKEGFDDPRWFKDNYYLVPDKVGNKAFVMIQKAMLQESVVGISKICFKSGSKEHLCIIRPKQEGILMVQTIHWPEELKDDNEFRVEETVGEKEVSMASLLIRSMTAPLDINKYQNNYATAFRQLIETKLAGGQISTPVPVKETETEDLFKALEASLNAMGVA